jgi:prophage regulatory protein
VEAMSKLEEKPDFLRLPAVKAKTGLSRSEIYRRIRANTFPSGLKIGPQTTVWNSLEINAWIADRIASRNREAAT